LTRHSQHSSQANHAFFGCWSHTAEVEIQPLLINTKSSSAADSALSTVFACPGAKVNDTFVQ
jgi:hypothetical protein